LKLSIKLIPILFLISIINGYCKHISGKYESFTVAFDESKGEVSGFFESYRGDQTNTPSFSCIFYFRGTLKDSTYSISVFSNDLKKITIGTLKYKLVNGSSVIKVKLNANPPGCIQINDFSNEQIYYQDEKLEITAVKLIKNSKAIFHKTPSSNAALKTYIIKGDFIKVYKEQGDFVFAEYGNKKKTVGWIKKDDLF
jgi:hypothetical protein